MEPIFLILYIVILTLLLTLVLPRIKEPNPAQRRNLWISVIAGGIVFLVITYFAIFHG